MLPFKFVAPIVVLVCVWLTYNIVNRFVLEKTSKNTLFVQSGKQGKGIYIYTFAIILILLSLFILMATHVANEIHDYIVLPKYQATVIDHHQYISTSTHNHHRVETLMYQPVVEFIDEQGQRVTIYSDISSSTPDPIGSTLTVVYQHGMTEAEEYSTRGELILFALSCIAVILGYILSIALCYAWGGNIRSILKFGFSILLNFILPLIMLLFLYLLGKVLYLYVAHFYMHSIPLDETLADLPWYMIALIVVFFIGLLLGLVGYLIVLVKGDKKRVK